MKNDQDLQEDYQIKKLECEGVVLDKNEKGKITYPQSEYEWFEYSHSEVLNIIKWIQETKSEIDLQTKTTEEILEEYKNDNN